MIDDQRIHETEEDRARQFEILTVFAAATGFRFIQTHRLWHYDAWIWRRGPYIRTEVKYRSHIFGSYPDFIIDQKKMETLVPGMLIVSWLGDIRYAEISELPKIVGWVQRADRAENADLVSHISLAEFKKL